MSKFLRSTTCRQTRALSDPPLYRPLYAVKEIIIMSLGNTRESKKNQTLCIFGQKSGSGWQAAIAFGLSIGHRIYKRLCIKGVTPKRFSEILAGP